MAIQVGWLDSSSSIGIFSIIISCRNYSQLDVEEWESLSWTRCNLAGRRVRSVRGVRKGAFPNSKSLIFIYIPRALWVRKYKQRYHFLGGEEIIAAVAASFSFSSARDLVSRYLGS